MSSKHLWKYADLPVDLIKGNARKITPANADMVVAARNFKNNTLGVPFVYVQNAIILIGQLAQLASV